MNIKIKIGFLSILTFANMLVSAQNGDPKLTEVYALVPPPKVNFKNNIPTDAVVLFDGKDLSQWKDKNGKPAPWTVADGAFTVKPGTGDISTKEKFGSQQLHLEFRIPADVKGEGQDRGNSGVFIMEDYEVQILDCYENKTYNNGQTGAIYKQSIPLANACKKAGEWQVYDIIFEAPQFNSDSSLKSPAFITVIHNGVLVQNHYQLKGKTMFIGAPFYTMHGLASLKLQDHNHKVSYRNIWLRKL